jgi:perosamine synthetase
MRDEFIIPKDPRLDWRLLSLSFRRNESSLLRVGRGIHHLFWARNAIYHGLGALGLKPGENVLVPSYHCKALVEPILQYGGQVNFYDVNTDLTPNFTDIENKIEHKTRAILLVHYFGFPQPIQKFRQICDAHNLFLIEDCAHVLTGSTPDGTWLGETGDISVFSWRKFLPISDGGQLVINNVNTKCRSNFEKGDFLFRLKMAKNTFDALLESSRIGQCLGAALGLPLNMLRKWMPLNRDGSKVPAVNSYDPEFQSSAVNLEMTALSTRILQHTDIMAVVTRRRDNYNRLTDALRGMPGVAPLFPFLPEEVCPWVFPLVVHRSIDLQPMLRGKGIPVTSWGGVIHKAMPLEKYPNARFLYKNLLFLPIHQSLNNQDLQTMVDILRKSVDEATEIEPRRQVAESLIAHI